MPLSSVPGNPGSPAALTAGCLCSARSNHEGLRHPRPGGWWINPSCPVHGLDELVQPDSTTLPRNTTPDPGVV